MVQTEKDGKGQTFLVDFMMSIDRTSATTRSSEFRRSTRSSGGASLGNRSCSDWGSRYTVRVIPPRLLVHSCRTPNSSPGNRSHPRTALGTGRTP